MVADSGDAGDASASDVSVGVDVVVKSDATPPPPPPLLDGGECNDVALLGADVPLEAVPQGPPPTPGDGLVPVPATYALESARIYTGQGGVSGVMGKTSVTIRVESDQTTWQVAASQDGKPPERQTFQLSKKGKGFTLTATCGGSDATPISFMPINSQGFALLGGSGNSVSVEVFRPFIK